MLALTYLSAIRFSDVDAGAFLHSQLSADVLGLSNGESTFACYCEPKGRVLALMLVCRVDENYYVIMSGALVSAVTERLKIYRMRSKVGIDVLDGSVVTGLDTNDSLAAAPETFISIPQPNKDAGYVVSTEPSTIDLDPVMLDAWKLAELKRGISWLCPETSGELLPQMLGFDQLGAVNYRKGCYPGQEIVARTHYLGKVKRHPRLLSSPGLDCPAPLDKIQILSGDEQFDAVVVDCVSLEGSASGLFCVTRMDPDLTAEKIKYLDQIHPVS